MSLYFSDFLKETTNEALNPLFEHPKTGALHISGLNIAAKSTLLASHFLKSYENILLITEDYKNAEEWFNNLSAVLPENQVFFFPPLGLKVYEEKKPFEGVLEERLLVFKELLTENKKVILCPVDALLMRLPKPGFLKEKTLHFSVGGIQDPLSLRPILLDMGFKEQPIVNAVGEFSIRSCIIDINGFLHEHPIRIEVFGDEIESIRFFDIFSQRSVKELDSIIIYPMGEFNIPEKDKFNFEENLDSLFWKRHQYQDLNYSLLDYLEPELFVFDDLSAIENKASSLHYSYQKEFLNLSSTHFIHDNPEKIWWKFSELTPYFSQTYLLQFTRVQAEISSWINYDLDIQNIENRGIDSVLKEIEAFSEEGGEVYLLAPTQGALNRLTSLFDSVSVKGFLIGFLSEGFWLTKEKIAFLTEGQIFNRTTKKRRRKTIANSVSTALLVESLTRGDFVVHEDHGVGRYLGLVRVEVNGGLVDCALLEYDGGDRLTFPVSDLQKIEKIQSSENSELKINRLGSKAFENLKSRVKKKLVQVAKELVELYAKRDLVEGFQFPKDNQMQLDFEDAFEYSPTPDQIRATLEVKRDMESKKPMDRLICGDVGFGKTEVAMRASFKAVSAKKQVILLVPTTILAAQHYESFQERFAAFPINIELINRYRSPKEKKEIYEKLKTGAVDIVVGTHALLSKNISYKDLGLLIIDEEQKFGVKQKEALRAMRLTVDTLSMSATPIPRSLHLSLTGVRDISLINTPPMNRLPVETKLLKRNDKFLAEAVQDELARGGQVFIVNDRVKNILELADTIENWVPDASIAVAHGQMLDSDLERVMDAFVSKKIDVLVSTSIIESGLDVPNANTIIIMNAQNFGISQLYQMRGRVGRSDILAHAYLVMPAEGEISIDSLKRLQALEQFTDLGSGYQLAMQDLEIRGAGNLLGSEQHGFISEIGFETYVRLVKEAVEQLKGGFVEKTIQPRVEVGVDAYLPEDWIEDGLSRIALYQRIARAKSSLEIQSITEEVKDRFGEIPRAAKMLFLVSEIGIWAGKLRIQGVQQKKSLLAITFSENPSPDPRVLAEILSVSPYPMRYLGSSPLQAIVELEKGNSFEQLESTHKVFKAFEKILEQPKTID